MFGAKLIISGGVPSPFCWLEGTKEMIVSQRWQLTCCLLWVVNDFVACLHCQRWLSISWPRKMKEEDVFVVRIVKFLLRSHLVTRAIKQGPFCHVAMALTVFRIEPNDGPESRCGVSCHGWRNGDLFCRSFSGFCPARRWRVRS